MLVAVPMAGAAPVEADDPAGDQFGAPLFLDRDLARLTLLVSNGSDDRPQGLLGVATFHDTAVGTPVEHDSRSMPR